MWVTVRSGSPSGPVVSFAVQGTSWTAPTSGTYYAHFSNNSACATASTCRTTSITTLTVPAVSVNPCLSIAGLTCGTASSFSLTAGTGAWNSYGGPFGVPGKEKVYSFTPTITGSYAITVTNNEYYVDLFYKSGACGATGWTYVNDIPTGSETNNVTLTAGVNYLFLIDDENTTASTGTITITCPTPAPDPCSGITNITSCGSSNGYTITAGAGAWNSLGGPYSTPGRERIFRFVPTTTASYPITVTNSGSGWVDLYYKVVSGPCGSTGWTYVDDVSGSATNSITLLAGQTYLFLLDDEDELGSTGTISLGCPCIGPVGGIDAVLTLSGPTSYSSTTTGACDDCSFRTGNDRVIAVNIPCAGSYSFDLCGGASWDTYLYLSTAVCGGTILASNDDACGLQSSLTYTFSSGGTYYITVEGFSSTSEGAFTLNINRVCNLSVSIETTDVSCFGGNNGTATAFVNEACGSLNYSWSNGSFTSSASGLAAGEVSVLVADAWGCTATASSIVTEPTALDVSLHTTEILCNGQNSTVDVTGMGGTAPYTGEGSFDVPAGSYTYTITDANGCSASSSVDIFEPLPLTAGSTVGSIQCFGGSTSVEVTANGGTLPYTGTGSYTETAGSYSYTVTDANGCSATTTVNISEPTLLVASNTSSAILCNGGTSTVEVAATGGTLPYSGTGSYTETAGAYSYTVTDANGCSATTTVSISEPTLLVASSSSSAILCYGGTSTVEVTAAGGTLPYSGTGSYTETAGMYFYTVTDGNGCTSATSIAISQPALLVASNTSSAILCNGGISTVDVSATGGTLPYSGTGSYTETAGAYSYTVTDANGCSTTTTVSISEPALLEASSSSSAILCFGGTSTVDVSATGGTLPYSGTGSYTETAGSYSYTVTDANGCSSTTTIAITEPALLTVDAGTDATVYFGYAPMACTNLSASSTGGTGAIVYTWSNGYTGAGQNVCPSSSTLYAVTATDANGCSATDEVNVCVVNVVCYAGSSSIEKVEVCHNGHTICINASAVPAHLAHGCTLGSCDEVNACSDYTAPHSMQPYGSVLPTNITLYPNPVKDILTVSIEHLDETSLLQVFNATGQMVYQTNVNEGSNTIDVSNWENSVYIIKINNQENPMRFIKQ
jgi:hypothetical protein